MFWVCPRISVAWFWELLQVNVKGDSDCLSRLFWGLFDPGLVWYQVLFWLFQNPALLCALRSSPMQSFICSLTHPPLGHFEHIPLPGVTPGQFRSMPLVPTGLGDPPHSLPQTLSLFPWVPEQWRSQQPTSGSMRPRRVSPDKPAFESRTWKLVCLARPA